MPVPYDLRQLCDEAGWPCIGQPGAVPIVDLDVPGAFYQAALASEASGQVRIATELGGLDRKMPETCWDATAVLLLRVCDAVRMARASVTLSKPEMSVCLEVVFGSVPCAAELAHAFAALSTACRLCAEEAEILQTNERIAQEYLTTSS